MIAHNSLYACDLEDSLISTLLTFQEISAYVNFSQSVSREGQSTSPLRSWSGPLVAAALPCFHHNLCP